MVALDLWFERMHFFQLPHFKSRNDCQCCENCQFLGHYVSFWQSGSPFGQDMQWLRKKCRDKLTRCVGVTKTIKEIKFVKTFNTYIWWCTILNSTLESYENLKSSAFIQWTFGKNSWLAATLKSALLNWPQFFFENGYIRKVVREGNFTAVSNDRKIIILQCCFSRTTPYHLSCFRTSSDMI